MCNRCQLPMYKNDQRKYFNWAAGIRATDKYHAVAQSYFERIQRLSAEGKELQIAAEGFEIAEQARKKVAELFGCLPRNVVFGNSASLVAMLLLRANLYFFKYTDSSNHLRSIGVRYHSDMQYPTIVSPSNLSRRRLKSILTQQNYGSNHSLLRSFPSEKLVKQLNVSSNRVKGGIASIAKMELKTNQDKHIFRLDKPFLLGIVDSVNRFNGAIIDRQALDYIDKLVDSTGGGLDRFLIDMSHSFTIDHRGLETLSWIEGRYFALSTTITNSSKGLGAEPTIGIGLAGHYALEELGNLTPRFYLDAKKPNPRIAFQFDPSLEIGPFIPEEILKTKYWISLPELKSMGVALEDVLRIGTEEIKRKLFELRKKLLGQLRVFPNLKVAEHFFSEYLHEDMPKIGYSSDYLPNYVAVKIEGCNGLRLSQELEKLGFVVQPFSTLHSIAKEKDEKKYAEIMKSYIRLSFRHDVDQDIDGLLNALEDVLKKGAKK